MSCLRCDDARFAAYQKALLLVDDVYRLTRAFPPEGGPPLADRFRRTAIAIALDLGA